MELIYRVKKPETIQRFMHENNIPSKILQIKEERLQIYVNKTLKSRKNTVKKGEKIHFFIKNEGLDKRVKPESIPLNIVFEDNYLLIVNKPKDMQMMISKTHPTGTLANAINGYYEANDIRSKIHFVTKLDREASGLIVVAKHKFIKFLLSDKQDNSITYYLKAILKGNLQLKEGCIPLPIARKEHSVEREVAEHGDECLTNFKVIEETANYTLVDVWIKNKLAHQIRVHFSYFASPIAGDTLYGETEQNHPLMLYCYKLDFVHPITEENIHLELNEPDYFKTLLATF